MMTTSQSSSNMSVSIINNDTSLPFFTNVAPWEWFFRFAVLIPLNVLYGITVYVINKKSVLFSSSYFTLIKALAVTDFLEIIYDLHLFVNHWFDVYYLGEVCGKYFRLLALIFAWYTNILLHFFIGVNRFCAVVYFQKYKELFSKKVSISVIVISNVYGLFCSIPWVYYCGLTLTSKPNYNPAEYLLICHPSVEYIYYLLDVGVGFAVFTTVLLSYIAAAIVSVIRLKSFVGSKSAYVREIKMMGQGVILILILGIVLIVYYVPIQGLRINAELVQTFYSSINAIVYLLFDDKLRKHVNRFIRCGKKSNQVMPNNDLRLI